LQRALQSYVLECYFGEVKDENRSRLEGMTCALMFFTAMWGLLLQGMQNRGLVQAEGFSFLEYADKTFETMRGFRR